MSQAGKLSFKSAQEGRERPAVEGRWHNPVGSVLETSLFSVLHGGNDTRADAVRLTSPTYGTQTVTVRFGGLHGTLLP
jgi:hypothetical protein